MTKVFIDGSAGTTGLRINERLEKRDDLELMRIDPEKRKDPEEIKKYINESDVTFLCLPDDAAREAVGFVEDPDTIVFDTSTAHRTEEGWAYGFPELSKAHRDAVINGKRIAVPGCHASGFISLVYPLTAAGILPDDYPVVSFSLTGYSGGGKKMIAQYEEEGRDKELDAPREYALSQKHKHLKEMQKICGLTRTPCFSPIVSDYYSGMLVSVPLFTDMLKGKNTPESIHEIFCSHYEGEAFVKVMPFGAEAESAGFLSGNMLSGRDGLNIFVSGNEERILLSAAFDNLGKGASGAAVECMNLALGIDPAKGLDL